jgi:hypothetical protein
MRVRILSCDTERPIHGIKGIRWATGLGLREAKAVIDRVRFDGEQPEIEIGDYHALVELEHYYGLKLMRLGSSEPREEVHSDRLIRNAIAKMPQHLSVSEVLSVLDAVLY